jgi:hypothetical protein
MAPAVFCGDAGIMSIPQSPVGASLLAMAVCQAMKMLGVPASSRASSLPQVQWLYAKSADYPNHCGSLLAMAVCPATLMFNVARSKDRSLRQLLQVYAKTCRSCRRLRSFDFGTQVRRARAPMAMNSAAIARASWRSPRATSSGICARGMRSHSRGSGSSPCSWQGLSCSASTTR